MIFIMPFIVIIVSFIVITGLDPVVVRSARGERWKALAAPMTSRSSTPISTSLIWRLWGSTRPSRGETNDLHFYW